MSKHILFVDNDPFFLSTRAEILERAGYDVLKASTLSEAEWLFNNVNVHLAIIDVRMQDNDDERDESGVAFAKLPSYRSVPKIILTGYATANTARSALKRPMGGDAPAVDFVDKRQDSEILLETIRETFVQHVRINWDLSIDWRACDSFSLAHRIDPELEGNRLLNRAEEVEDMIRRLFFNKDHVRIEKQVWQRDGRVALTAFTFKEGATPESLIVVCGRNSQMEVEIQRFEQIAPKTPGNLGSILRARAETIHYAASGYVLSGADLENTSSLVELYRSNERKVFATALETLFEKTLLPWQRDQHVSKEHGLKELYWERLGFAEKDISRQTFEERLQSIIDQSHILNARIERKDGKFIIRFDGQVISCVDPMPVFFQTSNIGRPIVTVNTPGLLSGDNILSDMSGKTWLTDFADAGRAPRLWNMVSLEAIIRFDWVDERNILRLYELEQSLLDETQFGRPNLQAVEPSVRNPIRALHPIRRLAARLTGKDYLIYHLGIFFQAARRLVEFNPTYPLTTSELGRILHAVLAMAMIATKIKDAGEDKPSMTKGERGIRIDVKDHVVYRDGNRIILRGQSYKILCYFYERPNQLCTRQEIVEQGLREPYSEKDESQVNRLNTAIRRLREKIEDDFDHPRYLLTEPGGYRLILKPS